MTAPSASSKILRRLRWVLGVVVFAGVAFALWRISKRWDGASLRVRPWPWCLSVGVLTIANFFQALAWKYLLEKMAGRSVPLRPALSVFMAGQLARYTPGKVALPMVRIAGAPKLGLSPRLIAASVGIEVGSWLGVGALVSFVALLCNVGSLESLSGLDRRVLWLGLFGTVAGFVAALVIDRKRFPAWVVKFLRAEGEGPFVSYRVLLLQLLSWVGWWLLGVLAPMSVGSPIADAIKLSPVFVVAPILGFLAFVAPGGLGVRETVITYALAPRMGATAAVATAILARAAAIVSEIISWIIGVLWERLHTRAARARDR